MTVLTELPLWKTRRGTSKEHEEPTVKTAENDHIPASMREEPSTKTCRA